MDNKFTCIRQLFGKKSDLTKGQLIRRKILFYTLCKQNALSKYISTLSYLIESLHLGFYIYPNNEFIKPTVDEFIFGTFKNDVSPFYYFKERNLSETDLTFWKSVEYDYLCNFR